MKSETLLRDSFYRVCLKSHQIVSGEFVTSNVFKDKMGFSIYRNEFGDFREDSYGIHGAWFLKSHAPYEFSPTIKEKVLVTVKIPLNQTSVNVFIFNCFY